MGSPSESTIDAAHKRDFSTGQAKSSGYEPGCLGLNRARVHKSRAKVDKTRARAVYTDARPRLYTCEGHLNGCEGCLNGCAGRLYECETPSARVRESPARMRGSSTPTAIASTPMYGPSTPMHRSSARMHGSSARMHGSSIPMRELSISIPIASTQTKIASIPGLIPLDRVLSLLPRIRPIPHPGLAASVHVRPPSERLSTRAVLALLAGAYIPVVLARVAVSHQRHHGVTCFERDPRYRGTHGRT